MLQTLKNAWKIPELRKKLLFTLFILLIYRLGSVIPVPFIDVTTLANYFDSVLSSTILPVQCNVRQRVLPRHRACTGHSALH